MRVFEEDMICKRDECYYVAAIPGDWQFIAVFCKMINSIETRGGGGDLLTVKDLIELFTDFELVEII